MCWARWSPASCWDPACSVSPRSRPPAHFADSVASSPGNAAIGDLTSCLFPTDVKDVLTAIGYDGLIVFMFMMGLELD